MAMDGNSDHGPIPAGVFGAGKFSLNYTQVFMHMQDNYICSSTVSLPTIVTSVASNMTMRMMG